MSINDFVDTKTLLFGMAIIIFIRYIRSESIHKVIIKHNK